MKPEIITSPTNQRVKNLLKLQKKSERIHQNLILIEGWREIRQAVSGGVRLKTIFLSENKSDEQSLNDASALCSELVILSNRVFEKAAYRENVEGVLAVGEPRFCTTNSLQLRKNPIIIVLESVEKPGNLGAVIRTAEAAAVDAIFTCDPLTDIYNPNVIRSSLGCVFTVPVIACTSQEAILFLRKRNIKIFATALSASQRYDLVNYSEPTAIVMGAESTGLSETWLKEAYQSIMIPMLGKHDSLNVSVSAAILIFEAMRQRGFDA